MSYSPPPALTYEQSRALIDEYRAGDTTQRKLAAKWGISRACVNRILHDRVKSYQRPQPYVATPYARKVAIEAYIRVMKRRKVINSALLAQAYRDYARCINEISALEGRAA